MVRNLGFLPGFLGISTPFPRGVELENSISPQARIEAFHLFGKSVVGKKAEGLHVGKGLSILQPSSPPTHTLSRKACLSPQPSQSPFRWKLR